MIALFLATAFLLQGATFALGEVSHRAIFILTLICVICTANILTIVINLFEEKNKSNFIGILTVILLAYFRYNTYDSNN